MSDAGWRYVTATKRALQYFSERWPYDRCVRAALNGRLQETAVLACEWHMFPLIVDFRSLVTMNGPVI